MNRFLRRHVKLFQKLPCDGLLIGPGFLCGHGARLGHQLPRAEAVHRVFCAGIQSGRRREHDQHHGRENADIGQAHRVLFHTVQHPRYRNKMVCPVIIARTLSQKLQPGDAPGRKKQVCPHDHQQHRYKKQPQSRQRRFRNDGNRIAGRQADKPRRRHQRLCFRLPLAGLSLLQKLDRACGADLPQGV